MKASQYNSSLRKRFLAFAAALVLLFALVFELYPRSSQIIDLSTGSGLSRMLRYDDAQVYIFGEIHRKVEYQKFRNSFLLGICFSSRLYNEEMSAGPGRWPPNHSLFDSLKTT